MYKFTSLRCYNCNSVIINLPESEAEKLNGLTFQCECCDYLNLLSNLRFTEAPEENLKCING